MKKYTTEQLEAAFEFIRIVNERGGYVLSAEGWGKEEDVLYELPDLTCLLNYPDECEHLPLPPKKVMMQMWRDDGGYSAYPTGALVYCGGGRTKVGKPFEFVCPEESK